MDDIMASVAGGAKRVFVIDRTKEDASDNVEELRFRLVGAGFDVGITTHAQKAGELCSVLKTTSILSKMRSRKDATILYLDASAKKLVLPEKLGVADNRIVIVYLRTHLQKNPYPKRRFDATHVINVGDNVNSFVAMAQDLLARPGADLEDVPPHDLNMVGLILMHNALFCAPGVGDCEALYDSLVAAETFATTEDSAISNVVQVAALLHCVRGNPARTRPFEFTQHLSRYSIQSGSKKKAIERADQLKAPGMCYEDILLANEIAPNALEDLFAGFKRGM